MDKVAEDARPVTQDEEAWMVRVRAADVRGLKVAVVAVLVQGAAGLWLLWRLAEAVRVLTVAMEGR